jgi:hypothetical protein
MSIEESVYRANPCLKRCNVQIDYTEEELTEYIKCSQDPIYFIENYVKIINVDLGLIPFKLWDFQKELINAIHDNRRVIGRIGRQSGKCLYFKGLVKIRNKQTGEIQEIAIGDLYDLTKKEYTDNI